MATITKLTANLTGKTVPSIFTGGEKFVAPVRMIVPGVMNGSGGPLLYPEDEIAKTVDAWNNMPIVVYHPTSNGLPVSARHPKILEESGIGYVFSSNSSPNLDAEAWVDVESCEEVDSRVMNSIDSGEPMELSTGLFIDNLENAPEGSVFNNTPYTKIARSYRPDHLAFLPDQVGACSLAGGCGVLVNQEGSEDEEKRQTFVHNDNNLWLTANELSHSDLQNMLDKELKKTFTQDEPNAWVSEVFDAYFVYRRGDDLFKRSYIKSQGNVSLSSETPQKVIRETSFVTVANTEEKTQMAKKELVDKLIAESSFTEGDAKVLVNFEDSKIEAMLKEIDETKKSLQVANTVKEGIEKGIVVNDRTIKLDMTKNEWVEVAKPATEPTTNDCGCGGSSEPKQLTANEFLKDAPEEIKSAIRYGIERAAEDKEAIVNKLVANVSDEEKAAKVAILNAKTIDDLKLIASFAPVPTTNTEEDKLKVYFGGGAPSTTTNKVDRPEPLGSPTINWADEQKLLDAQQ